MSNQEDFEKWLDQDVDDAVTVRDVINTLATKETAALSGYEQRQPEIDALETTREKLHEMLVRRNIEICELKAEITRLRTALEKK